MDSSGCRSSMKRNHECGSWLQGGVRGKCSWKNWGRGGKVDLEQLPAIWVRSWGGATGRQPQRWRKECCRPWLRQFPSSSGICGWSAQWAPNMWAVSMASACPTYRQKSPLDNYLPNNKWFKEKSAAFMSFFIILSAILYFSRSSK